MSEVTLQVGGRPYTISCADGEEDHVRRLAGVVDGKLAGFGSNLAPGDAKNLLLVALILADEAEDARRTAAASAGGDDAGRLVGTVASGLEALADRLETVALALETAGANA